MISHRIADASVPPCVDYKDLLRLVGRKSSGELAALAGLRAGPRLFARAAAGNCNRYMQFRCSDSCEIALGGHR